MRADLFVCSGVLLLGLMTACHVDSTAGDAGPGSDAGEVRDGGSPDAGTDGGAPPDTAVCDVAAQTGCAAGAVCLRGLLGDGGVASQCFSGECDAVKQTCPAGSRCAYVERDNATARRCVPTGTSPVNEGGECRSTAAAGGDFYDTCAPGLSCTDRSASGGGTTFTCQRLCYSAAQCASSRDCIDVLRFEGSPERPRVCGSPGAACDVLASSCASPRGCYPSSGSGVCVTAGSLGAGQACEYVNDCQAGSACVSADSGRVCRALCRSPSGSPACTGGLRCQALPGYSGVGVCVP